MFEELGLNVARQPDNGANPRPDNRSGWLDGETPATPVDELIDRQAEANFWDPSTQLRVVKKKGKVPAYPARPSRTAMPPRPAGATSDRPQLSASAELESSGLRRRLRLVDGPQGPEVLLDGQPVLLLCSNNYLGLAGPSAPAPGGRRCRAQPRHQRGGVAADLRLDVDPLRARGATGRFKGTEAALLFGSGYLANTGAIAALARRGEVVFSDELNHASIIDGCRLAGAETFVYRHARHRAPRVGPAPRRRPGRADRHRRRLLDGRRHRPALGALGPGAPASVPAASSTRRTPPAVSAPGDAARSPPRD